MSSEQAFYTRLGYELMEDLAGSYVGAELIPGGASGVYQTLMLRNGMNIRFTSVPRRKAPFYITLCKGAKYVFELDLSMIVHRQGHFDWHLGVPSNKTNASLLEDWLGKPASFDHDYSDSVTQVKSSFQSGMNTPRKGFWFIGNAKWPSLCDHFQELMSRVIDAHTNDASARPQIKEVTDDDGGVVGTTRKARRNQSQFRLNMMELYDSACAISGVSIGEVLEAAHILRHSETGVNHTGNGLLLRVDLHRLFDANLIAVNPESLKIWISRLLKGTKTYQELSGRKLRSRNDHSSPNPEYLKVRWDERRHKN